MTKPTGKKRSKSSDPNAYYNKTVAKTLIPGKEYAVTFSPNPALFPQMNIRSQYLDMKSQIFKKYKNIAESLFLYPELTQIGNTHFHGIIVFKDVVTHYIRLKSFVHNVGQIVLKEIDDREGWMKYMKKEYLVFSQVFAKKGETLNLPDSMDIHFANKKQDKAKQKLQNNIGSISHKDILSYLNL